MNIVLKSSSYRFLVRLSGVFVTLILLCYITGRFEPHLVSDTPSYTGYSFGSFEAIAMSIRSPGYPAILRISEFLVTPTGSLQAAVILAIFAHALAVCLWLEEFTLWRVPRLAAWIGCGALAVTNTFWDHINTIATDSISMSIGLVIACLVARAWRRGLSVGLMLTIGALIIIVIAIRPAYLFLLPWAFAAMLIRPAGAAVATGKLRICQSVAVVTIPVVALVMWCGFRGGVTGDFGILPFGHQNMAAVTTQLLDNDELSQLPGEAGKLGSAIGQSRLDLLQMDQRAEAYMTLEGRWDDMTYSVVIPAAAETIGENTIAQHKALAHLDSTIVRTYPLRYAKWIVLGIRRGIWGSFANLAMHPIYFPCLIMLALVAIAWSTRLIPQQPPIDWSPIQPFVLVTISYALAKISFVALTSPPIGRFSDAAMAMVPMLAAVVVSFLIGNSASQMQSLANRNTAKNSSPESGTSKYEA